MKPSKNPFVIGSSLAALALSHSAAQAEGIWDGGIGNFDVATNWDNDAVPSGVNTVVNNGGTIQIDSDHNTFDILAGTTPGGSGTWEHSAGVVSMNGGWFRLGTEAGAVGAYNLSGGELNTGGQQNIGEANGGTGHVKVSGGTWNNHGAALTVGGNSNSGEAPLNNSGGIGTLELSGTGTINNFNELWIGAGGTGDGTMTISGGTINQQNWLAVGRSGGNGTLNMTGGTFNKTDVNSDAAIVGDSGAGTFNQNGGQFNVDRGYTWIGNRGHGTWLMSGGTANLQELSVGWETGGVGVLTLQSAASSSTGGLDNGGGDEVLTATELWIGDAFNSTGTVNLDGGTLAVNFVATFEGSGTLNFNGGTLRARSNDGGFVTGVSTWVKEGGAVIDSNGYAVTVDTVLQHGGDAAIDGGLTKNGGGTLTLNQVNRYTGPTVINGGVLKLSATGSIDSSSEISLGTSGRFDVSAKDGYTVSRVIGTGAFIGGVSVSTSLAIGNSTGTINFSDSLALGSSSTFEFELTGGTSDADLANVVGNLTINGGMLQLIQLGSYTHGEKFTLFSYSGSLIGEFNARLDDSVFTEGGGMWQINYDDPTAGLNGGSQSKFVTITAVPEPASAALLVMLGTGLLIRRRRNA